MSKTQYHNLFTVTDIHSSDLSNLFSSEDYHILLFEGKGTLSVDFIDYNFNGKIILFTSPFQHFKISTKKPFKIKKIAFHGDFYCIEYHKEEVACNGLLFNNIFSQPFILLNDNSYKELNNISEKLIHEIENRNPYSTPVLKAYLQVILAISSKIKNQEREGSSPVTPIPQVIENFKLLLEQHFINQRQTNFYANELAISSSVFTKKCKEFLGKPPSTIIQERVMLEAKKLIHLTRKSIKEIAAILNFEDEHYFSRYFKKHTGVTTTQFREKVGISIVADLSNK